MPFLVSPELSFVHRTLGWIAGQFGFAVCDLPDQLIGRKIFDQFARVHTQGAEGSEPCFDCRVVDSFGMKLKLDPFLEAHLLDTLHVAGPRAEGEPVERVDSAFMLVHCSGRFVFFPRGRELGSQACNHQQTGCNCESAAAKEHSRPH